MNSMVIDSKKFIKSLVTSGFIVEDDDYVTVMNCGKSFVFVSKNESSNSEDEDYMVGIVHETGPFSTMVCFNETGPIFIGSLKECRKRFLEICAEQLEQS